MTDAQREQFEKWYAKSGFNHRYCAEAAYDAGVAAENEACAKAICERCAKGDPLDLDRHYYLTRAPQFPKDPPQERWGYKACPAQAIRVRRKEGSEIS